MKKGGGARGLCWPGIRVVAVEMDMEIRGHEIGAGPRSVQWAGETGSKTEEWEEISAIDRRRGCED